MPPHERTTINLMVAYYSSPLEIKCGDCKKPLTQGNYAVGATFGNQSFIVIKREEVKCCGKMRDTALFFEEKEQATVAKDEITKLISAGGKSMTQLALYKVEDFCFPTAHSTVQ